MAWNFYRILNYTIFIGLSVILFCLIVLTPADAIYQCYVTSRLTNIFIISGGYIVTFILAALIYATRIYTNRSALAGIPKAWIPIEKEDVGKSVRRLVVEGLARSAIVAYQARPRDTAADGDTFADYPMLLIDRDRPPWGSVEHPGWSSPASPDLPDLPYRTVIQELPNLIEAKAVSLAPPDPFLTATRSFDPSSPGAEQSIPDTRVVDILRRPVSMGLREYLQHLASLNVIQPPEIGAEFIALYERARFSSRELHETEFRDLMHIFAGLLRGMKSLDTHIMDDIYAEGSRGDSESVIGPSDEEGETDTMDFHDDSEAFSRGRSNSLQPSNASTWEGRSTYAASGNQSHRSPVWSRNVDPHRLATPRTPSMRSLRRVQSNASGSSGGSVIRLVDTHGPTDLPYAINFNRT
ncbi:aminotransferase, classes I and II, putative [Aspergillus oryzae 100-8]|nr:aminotransferase, classes I and II, putative [Aspergillus oryzae 3.042]KDE79220.1 aminotransferase, classes I and II, putative [Aspergillus oryzae 100-8]|eukprot:EIT80797.1 aminotransferase, classes I and II, putative [Aspergillus oryzae 3.042]